MKRLWKILGILVGTALLLNVATEILNRKSFLGTVSFVVHTPMVFVLDTLLFLAPFLLVFFTRRKVFLTIVLFVLGLTAAIANSVLLVFRTTPFTASDEICGNASYNVSDLVADYSDGSGSRCGGYVLRAALEKGTNGCAEG